MIQKTKYYDLFKFREDNRSTIDQAHVRRLAESIKSRNLLELRPITVNDDMEVIDGQHRLMAAKLLGVDIYYQVNRKLQSEDIVIMNIYKPWSALDFLNYFCKNGFEQYQKLDKFIKQHNISLKVALSITMGAGDISYYGYKTGKYVFNEEVFGQSLDHCWDTIGYIKKMNGFSPYTSSARFWKALIKLVRHADFDPEKWKQNLSRMVERFGPRARIEDYYRLMMETYNWKNALRIDLLEN